MLADMHDEWQAGDHRYLSEESMALLYPDRDNARVAIESDTWAPRTSTSKPTTPHGAVLGRGEPVVGEHAFGFEHDAVGDVGPRGAARGLPNRSRKGTRCEAEGFGE